MNLGDYNEHIAWCATAGRECGPRIAGGPGCWCREREERRERAATELADWPRVNDGTYLRIPREKKT